MDRVTRKELRMAQDSDDLFIVNIVVWVLVVILAIVALHCLLPRRVVRWCTIRCNKCVISLLRLIFVSHLSHLLWGGASVFPILLRVVGKARPFVSQICYPMTSCLGEGSSIWKYGRNRHFCSLFGTEIGVSLFIFLLWAPALLQDPAPPFDPQFFCSYFYLCAFVRSFSGHRAPF